MTSTGRRLSALPLLARRGLAQLPEAQQLYQLPPHLQQHVPQPQPHAPQQPGGGAPVGPPAAPLKLYRGKWILPVRFLVRAKVFQLMGGGSVGLALGSLTMQEATLGDTLALAALAGGMVAASCCLWYYSRRYVGEMALLPPDQAGARVRLSVLDFWGNRENNDVPLAALQPPLRGLRPKQAQRLAAQPLFPVNVEGDRQYYLSIVAGHILQPQLFFNILRGEPLDLAAVKCGSSGDSSGGGDSNRGGSGGPAGADGAAVLQEPRPASERAR